MPFTNDLPDWITKALEADPTPAATDLLDRIADDFRCARSEKDAWGHTASVIAGMDAAEARADMQKARAALGLSNSRAKPNYGVIFDAYDAACEAQS